MRLKQLPVSILVILSILLVTTGMASCQKGVDAFECVLITNDNQGKEKPLNQWYLFCLNSYTKEEKTIWLKDMTKCITDPSQSCKWVATDILEREKFKKEYEKQCKEE